MKPILATCIVSIFISTTVWAVGPTSSIADRVRSTKRNSLSVEDMLERAKASVVLLFIKRFPSSDPAPYCAKCKGPCKDWAGGETGTATGVLISKEGYLITNKHVITRSDQIRVQVDGYNNWFIAEVVGSDDKLDIAVLRIQVDGPLSPITLGDSDRLRPGNEVFAIGRQRGSKWTGTWTATKGIVSATNVHLAAMLTNYSEDERAANALRPDPDETMIQSNAVVVKGDSGGALVDRQGRLIGISTATLASVSESGMTTSDAYFSIPVNVALRVAERLISASEK